MLFFFILSLTFVLGVRCESMSVCDSPPECLEDEVFPEGAYEDYEESGDLLPSNELFNKSCDFMVRSVKCSRDFHKVCSNFSVDLDVTVDLVVEFCNPESDLRKDYVAHVGCLNRINFFTSCAVAFKMADDLSDHVHEILEAKNIQTECFVVHVAKPCIVETVEKTCGEAAGQATSNFIDRGKDIFSCSEGDADYFDELIANFQFNLLSG